MTLYSTLGAVTMATHLIAVEVCEASAKAGYPLGVLWGYNATSAATGGEHGTGMALDFMVSHAPALNTAELRQAAGDFIADYLWQHRERLDLQHEIWCQRIRSTTNTPGVWRDLADRGSVTQNHYDHVHALFNGRYAPLDPQGSQGDSSGTVIVPTAPPVETKIGVDGSWGSETTTRWQKRRGLKEDGSMGGESIMDAQAAFRTLIDGVVSGQATRSRLPSWVQGRIQLGHGGSNLIKAIAKDLKANGYDTNGTDRDGLAGLGFVTAVQNRLNADPTWPPHK